MTLPETEPALVAPPKAVQREDRSGLLAAAAAYGSWGFLPILFRALDGVPAVLIVAERSLWSLLLVSCILVVSQRIDEVRAVLADRAKLKFILLSGLVLASNWLLYVYAVESERVLEASFGYFINPLVNVAMGMVLLKERQTPLQLVAIGIAVVAILIQGVGLGNFPFIAVGLALTFGVYGYLRKTASVGSTTGLFVETLLVSPFWLAYVVYFTATSGAGPHADPVKLTLLVMTGPATAIPLLLFAYGVQRLRLTTVGMLQYLAPSLQFGVAILLFGEQLDAVMLFSFALIWLSLLVFTVDSFRQRRSARTAG